MSDNTEELKLEPVDENGVSMDELKDAIADAQENSKPAPVAATAPGEGVINIADKVEALEDAGAVVEGDVENSNVRISLSSNSPFSSDARAKSFIDNMKVRAREQEIEVTTQDKVSYLKAALMDEEVVLDVPIAGGKMTASFRTMSAYEQDMLEYALVEYLHQHTGATVLLAQCLKQHFMMAMELVAFNGKAVTPLRYEPGGATIEEHAKDFVDKVARFMRMNAPRYTLLNAGADIFHAKIGKLLDASANKDFWDPAFAEL